MLNLPEQTPAQTAREDLTKYSPNKNKQQRHKDVEALAKQLFEKAVVDEQLRERYANPDQREAVMKRAQELAMLTRQKAQKQVAATTIPDNQRRLYSRARSLLGIESKWNSGGKEDFFEALERSAQDVRAKTQALRNAATWLESCKPTIAQYTNEEGKEEFNDFDVVIQHYEGGVTSSQNQCELYYSIIRGFDHFINRWNARASAFEDELAKYDEDPIGDIKICIEDHFDLTPIYEDVEDGCLWYYNPRTNCLHFFNLCWDIDVDMSFNGILEKYQDNWQDAWHGDLRNVIDIQKVGPRYPAQQDCKSYFGLWNDIRPWVEQAVGRGMSIPAGFPQVYVAQNIQGT